LSVRALRKVVKLSQESEHSRSFVDVLIVTTSHHQEDGRLVRHRNSLLRGGIKTEIVSFPRKARLAKYVIGIIWAYRTVRAAKPKCVILPDPELHLFLSPFIKRKLIVISDVHEDYVSVMADRDWVRGPLKSLVRFSLLALPRIRDRFSNAVVVADQSFCRPEDILIENIPHHNDLPEHGIKAPFRAVYVGDIRPSRGIKRMIDLVDAIPKLTLDLVGPCVSEEEMAALISEKGLSDRITWHGRQSYKRSWEIASTCSVGLCLLDRTPAFDKAIPSKVWEYWAVGIPVVVSDLDRLSQLINEVGGGIVLGDEKSVSKIQRWITDENTVLRAGSQGHEYFMGKSIQSSTQLVKLVSSLT